MTQKYSSKDYIALTDQFSAPNYGPIDVVLTDAKGVWVNDVEGKRYLDMLSAYSAVSFGHSNERLIAATERQIRRLATISRAFYNDVFALFCQELAQLCGMESVLPMNTGAEAVETGVKLARRWGYQRKGIPRNEAEIICFKSNFHGRTTTVISFSDSASSTTDFGPYTPGFKLVPFGDIEAVRAAVTDKTAAILCEPIQGEGGVIIPPLGFLRDLRSLCTEKNILFIADEVQTGFHRTGPFFACDLEGVKADVYLLGKALGGGIYPVSAVVSRREILNVFTPGSHGSTFGGNPLAVAIAREVMAIVRESNFEPKVTELGEYFRDQLRAMNSPLITDIRGKGLLTGVEVSSSAGLAKNYCKKLKDNGVLSKDTRDYTLRFAPALTIEKSEIDWGLERIREVFKES